MNMTCYFLRNNSFIRITLLHPYTEQKSIIFCILYSTTYIYIYQLLPCCVFTIRSIHNFLQVEVVIAQLRKRTGFEKRSRIS